MATKQQTERAIKRAETLMGELINLADQKREIDERIKGLKDDLQELHAENRDNWGKSIRLANGALSFGVETKVDKAENFDLTLCEAAFPDCLETKLKPSQVKSHWKNPDARARLEQIGVTLVEMETHTVKPDRKYE